MKLSAYRVIAGVHHHQEPGSKKATIYGPGMPAGDIIVTSQNLMAAFANKFVKVEMPATKAAPAPAAPSPQPTPESGAASTKPAAAPDSETPSDAKSGVDVTVQFPKARKAGFVVFKRTDGYFVADRDNPTKFANKKALAKGEVDAFIASLE